MALFSSEENPIHPLVAKATDSNQTAENWEYILDVCDKVNEQLENGPKWAMDSVMSRLSEPNANVQLFSLTLISSLAQNCGSKMQREIASRRLCDKLYSMCGDRNVHNRVKVKIISTLDTLDQEMARDPSLKVVHDTYTRVQREYPLLAAGPAKPKKHEITQSDRQREEDELQMVLALSLAEAESGNGNRQSASQSYGYPSTQQVNQQSSNQGPSQNQSQNQNQNQNQNQQENPQRHTAATVTRVRALYDLNASEQGELSFRKGDIIHVIESVYRDWWRGSLRGDVGIFPLNYVTPLPEPTAEELEKEAQDELNVVAQSRNIEKLLALLSSTDPSDAMRVTENEELQNLYHSTLSLRPKLARLIEKYSQKRDDLMNLNDKFLSARRTYEQLMEQSINQATHSSQSPLPSHQPQSAYSPQIPQMSHQQQQQPMYGVDGRNSGLNQYAQASSPPGPPSSAGSHYGHQQQSSNVSYPAPPPSDHQQQQQQQHFDQQRPVSGSYSVPQPQPQMGSPSPQHFTSPPPANAATTAASSGHRLPYPVNDPPPYR